MKAPAVAGAKLWNPDRYAEWEAEAAMKAPAVAGAKPAARSRWAGRQSRCRNEGPGRRRGEGDGESPVEAYKRLAAMKAPAVAGAKVSGPAVEDYLADQPQ